MTRVENSLTALTSKLTAFANRFHAWRQTYFPERQLFLRSEGRVRFLTIHSYVQMGIAGSLLVALIWGSVTSYAYLSRDRVLEGKNRTISTMSSQYKTLSSDFSALEAEVERRAQLLEERQRFLEEMLQVEPSEPVEIENSEAITPQTEDVAEPQASLIDQIFSEASVTASTPGNSERRSDLLARLENLDKRQQQVVGLMLSDVATQMAFVEETLAPTNISSSDLIPEPSSAASAVGGPFIPERTFDGVFAANDGVRYMALRENTQRLKMVTNALNSYPVGTPVEKYYISDRYGPRIDPFKKVRSQHYGLDMAGWPGSSIEATAPGTVVYSGWYGPYGNMIEVDHGNGFRTRYGHMRKLSVKKNEQVELGQKLGEMGKTGRATGTHLHYEVWFADKVRDPMPFLKAAENVLKIQGRHEETNE